MNPSVTKRRVGQHTRRSDNRQALGNLTVLALAAMIAGVGLAALGAEQAAMLLLGVPVATAGALGTFLTQQIQQRGLGDREVSGPGDTGEDPLGHGEPVS